LTRYTPGTLTNWEAVSNFVSRVKSNPSVASNNKKLSRRWLSLKGLKNLTSRPDVLVLFHAKDHAVAISEARQINIPTIGIVDTDANGSDLTYPVFGNDDSLEAQFLYCRAFSSVFKSPAQKSVSF